MKQQITIILAKYLKSLACCFLSLLHFLLEFMEQDPLSRPLKCLPYRPGASSFRACPYQARTKSFSAVYNIIIEFIRSFQGVSLKPLAFVLVVVSFFMAICQYLPNQRNLFYPWVLQRYRGGMVGCSCTYWEVILSGWWKFTYLLRNCHNSIWWYLWVPCAWFIRRGWQKALLSWQCPIAIEGISSSQRLPFLWGCWWLSEQSWKVPA